jgi:hypothetical protein
MTREVGKGNITDSFCFTANLPRYITHEKIGRCRCGKRRQGLILSNVVAVAQTKILAFFISTTITDGRRG